MTCQLFTMKTLPIFFNQVNKPWLWKDNIFPIIYYIKYYRGGFEKIWIIDFIYIIFQIFYYSLFAYLALRLRGNITSNSPQTKLCLDFSKCRKFTSPFWLSKLKTYRYACARIRSEPTTAAFLGRWFHLDNQRIRFFAWSIQYWCNNIGIFFSGLHIKYWLTYSIGTHWWIKL